MNFRQIEAFRAVMMSGSATTAGKILYISQPAVSRLLGSLEFDIGFKLFERRNNRLVPTEEGRTFFGVVEQSFVGLDHIAHAAEAIRTASTGILRIAATPLIAHSILPGVVAKFIALHPDIRVEMRHGSREFVIGRVASQAFDIGIEAPPVDVAGVRESMLFEHTAVLAMSADNELAKKQEVEAEDIVGMAFIVPEAGSRLRFAIDQALQSRNVRVRVVVETSTQEAICQLIARNVGVALVSPYVARSSAFLPIVFRPFSPSVHIMYSILFPTGRMESILARKFNSFLREELESGNVFCSL